MTNADKIRNMTDEELTEFLYKFDKCNHCIQYVPFTDCECAFFGSDLMKLSIVQFLCEEYREGANV